jgi:hypothetical protein
MSKSMNRDYPLSQSPDPGERQRYIKKVQDLFNSKKESKKGKYVSDTKKGLEGLMSEDKAYRDAKKKALDVLTGKKL